LGEPLWPSHIDFFKPIKLWKIVENT
jgi:hypothetical protein